MNVHPDKLPVSRVQRVVRYIGAVILSACAVMLVMGLTNRLQGLQLLQYWSWCFLLAAASILCALCDMILVRRAFRRTRRKLFHEHFMTGEIAEKLSRKKPANDKGPPLQRPPPV
jgi:hypothetical protein